jgi:hypothetical protein
MTCECPRIFIVHLSAQQAAAPTDMFGWRHDLAELRHPVVPLSARADLQSKLVVE